ncbi:hypothetical protein [Pelagibaculum spongiae]|uniref:Uncharacterized protein n=1 Tax=Pelagibaculum spongiae TaxID=2080658 RepID=A0A2V1GWU7_9GAMM|nr:hypothetical protein [Pelagibaculum spongiae]PVZ70480.1 hypothetical protein DC094_07815 [Pelagibaculum spongiae]
MKLKSLGAILLLSTASFATTAQTCWSERSLCNDKQVIEAGEVLLEQHKAELVNLMDSNSQLRSRLENLESRIANLTSPIKVILGEDQPDGSVGLSLVLEGRMDSNCQSPGVLCQNKDRIKPELVFDCKDGKTDTFLRSMVGDGFTTEFIIDGQLTQVQGLVSWTHNRWRKLVVSKPQELLVSTLSARELKIRISNSEPGKDFSEFPADIIFDLQYLINEAPLISNHCIK